jgi:hypothetical protein
MVIGHDVANTGRAEGLGFSVLLLCLFVTLPLLLGCLPASLENRGDSSLDVGADFEFPVRVAVLPFSNRTDEPTAPKIVRRLFFNFFSSLNYRDKELFLVDQTLQQEGLYQTIADGEAYSMSQVCRALDVDAVITGEVLSFNKLFAVVYAQREVGLKAGFYQCSNKRLLWSKEETATERDGSLFSDVTALFLTVVKTYFSHRRATSIQNTAKLCMSMVATIPNPIEVSAPPPQIKQMIHNGVDRIIRPGEALRAVLIGEPGLIASWDVSADIQDLPLMEKSPGVYIGEYIVQEDDRVVNGRLDGRLASKSGVTSRWIDVTDGIFLGHPTTPPLVIEKDLVFTAEHSPYLVEELLLIKPGATLFIKPGVIMLFKNAGIVVQGRVEAKGEQKRPISFSGLAGNPWKGLLFYGGSGLSYLQHVTIRDAGYGIKARASSVEVDQSAFLDNTWGLVIESDSRLKMSRSLVHGSESTGLSAKQSDLEISKSLFSANVGGGIQVLNSKITLSDSDIFDNGPWEFRNHDAKSVLALGGNWWGTTNRAKVSTLGAVEIKPIRQKPNPSINMHNSKNRR